MLLGGLIRDAGLIRRDSLVSCSMTIDMPIVRDARFRRLLMAFVEAGLGEARGKLEIWARQLLKEG